MVRKSCRVVTGEVAVMDMAGNAIVGVTTRARAHAMAAPATDSASGAAKRRRTGMMNHAAAVRFCESSTCTQVGSNADWRLVSEKSTSRAPPTEDNCSRYLNPSSDDEASISCCSSYGSSVQEKDKVKFADLEDQDESAEVDASTSHFSTERRENITASSKVGEKELNGMDSVVAELMVAVNTPPPLSKDEQQLLSDSDSEEVVLFPEIDKQPEIMKPTEAEIEDFFTVMEASHLEHFKKRYNFDFAKEEPLEGRYEWRQRT